MPDSPDRGVYLILTTRSGLGFKVYLPEQIPHGYTNKLEAKADQHVTHPQMHLWKGGSVNDIPLEVTLMVGMPGIPTPEALEKLVNTLQDMALPEGQLGEEGAIWLETVTMSVGRMGGKAWYQRRVFIKGFNAVFVSEPVYIDSGRTGQCKVSMTLVPTYAPQYSHQKGDLGALPRRPFSLSRG
jgi:hypothetical protein